MKDFGKSEISEAKTGFLLGMLSIPGAFLCIIPGIILGILGYVKSKYALNIYNINNENYSVKEFNKAKNGIRLSIIGGSLSLIFVFISILGILTHEKKNINHIVSEKQTSLDKDINAKNNDADTIGLNKELQILSELIITSSGFTVKGKTNLPNGTKLAFDAIRNEKVCAQNFDIYVIDNKFEAKFDFDISKVEEIEINCYANSMWQDNNILKKLKSIQSSKWNNSIITEKINVIAQFEDIVSNIIGNKSDYKPIGTMDGQIKDVSMGKIKRLTANIICTKQLSDDDITQEIKY